MGFGDFFKKSAGLIGAGVGFMVAGPAGAAAGASIGGGIGGGLLGRDAAKAEKKAANAQRRQAQLQSWQNSMNSLREFQRAQAMSATAFQGSGASLESSAAQGVRSSLGATESRNQELLAQNVSLGNEYYRHLQNAAKARGNAAIASSLGQIASAAFSVMPTGTPDPGSVSTVSGTGPMGTNVPQPGSTLPTDNFNTIDPFGGP